MKFITLSKARANLSEFVCAVEAGEEVIVTQRGVPAMKVVRPDIPGRRRMGLDAGAVTVPDAFDARP